MQRSPVSTPPPLKRLLVATDFSSGAAAALGRVSYLPLAPRAEITILHVLPGHLGPALRPREIAEAEHRLRGGAAALTRKLKGAGRKEVSIKTAVAHGQPHLEIQRRSQAADLVVIGRHGRRPFRDLLVGSTAERVVQKGEVAVLLVARRARSAYRRPIVAVELSEASRATLDLAMRVVAPGRRMLDVVHAYETAHEQVLHRVATSAARAAYNRECRARARSAVEQLIEEAGAAGAIRALVLRRTDPRPAVLSAARGRGADLIVLGTHARRGLGHLLLGSVAGAVMRHATCDVLVAPPPRPRKSSTGRAS